MSQQNLPSTHVYIDIQRDPDDPDFNYRIEFYDNANATQPRSGGGRIEVSSSGSLITFHKVSSPQLPFDFHELVLHPMGAQANRLEMKWFVTPEFISLHDLGRVRQQFNYCLGVTLTDEAKYKVYFDPQMINLGGGPV